MKFSLGLAAVTVSATLAFAGCSAGVKAGPADGDVVSQPTVQVGSGDQSEPGITVNDGSGSEVTIEGGSANGGESKVQVESGSEEANAEEPTKEDLLRDLSDAGQCGESRVDAALSRVRFSGNCTKLVIDATKSTVVFNTADEVILTGSLVRLVGKSIKKLTIEGASNHLELDTVGDVLLTGSNNLVEAKVTGKFENDGIHNRVGG